MDTIDLSAELDFLARNHYIITERDLMAATGRTRRTVRAWLESGAPAWVWACALAYRGIFEIDGEFWRIDKKARDIITPEFERRRLGEIRGMKYMIGAKQAYRRRAAELEKERDALKAENLALKAANKKRPLLAANDEF